MKIKFNIECEMETRWIPYFLAMLAHMEFLGKIGSSKLVTLYSDGDGDFRPSFIWDTNLPEPTLNYEVDEHGNTIFDAG